MFLNIFYSIYKRHNNQSFFAKIPEFAFFSLTYELVKARMVKENFLCAFKQGMDHVPGKFSQILPGSL